MQNESSKTLRNILIIGAIAVIGLIAYFWPERDPFYQDRERIGKATELQIELIGNGLDRGFSVDNVHVVQYGETNIWFAGGLLYGSILRDVFACWLIDQDSEQVFSVDFLAEEYSRFPAAIEAGFDINYPNEECGILANFLE